MITFTTERQVFDSKAIVTVRWNDANNTILRVHDNFAAIYHAGEVYFVEAVSKNREATRRYWTERITKRLEEKAFQPSTRLQDRLRNWKTDWTGQQAA